MNTQKTIIDSIDVRDLPFPVKDMIQTVTDALRAKSATNHHAQSRPLSHGILQKPGRALKPATREVIYGDDL